MSPRRDGEFYCQDVVFLVEDVLFKVPRRPFEQESIVFKDMFDLGPDKSDRSSVLEGTADDNPIRLGVKEEEFRALLWVMLRPAYGSTRVLTKEHWIFVLKLANMWRFDGIREQAIHELGKLVPDPVSRIALARTHSITGWMEPALASLAKQEVLSAADIETLGCASAAKLFQVRESVVWGGSCACSCNYCDIAHGPVAQHPNGHPGQAHLAGAGSRPAVISAAALRKSYNFTQKIREVFGTDLY